MKVILLFGGLTLISCSDFMDSNSTEHLSDEEMKNRVEAEEIEYELKDSMISQK